MGLFKKKKHSKQWVLLAAGSRGWKNYRHQADVCHAYHVVRRNGIPKKRIVVMMYDDIADNPQNPIRGNIINRPSGPNVYPGVPKDYTGAEVSAGNFLAVLSGDSAAVNKTGRKKVIKSHQNDVIFIFLSAHGGHGVFQFPHSTLYAHDLINTVKTMSTSGKFSKMVIYLEACSSGSMLEELRDSNVYAVAACRPNESSCACFYDLYRNVYLADVFSAFWLHHTKRVKLNTTSLGEQFSYLLGNVSVAVQQGLRKRQTPCNYGDMNLLQLPLSEFLGKSPNFIRRAYNSLIRSFQGLDVVDSTDVPLIIMENSIRNEQNPGKRETLTRQYHELKEKRRTVDEALQKIAERTNASQALTETREVTRTYEFKVVAEHFKNNLFNWEKEQFVVTRSHLQVLVNLCECGLEVESITQAITHVSEEMTS